MLHALHPVHTGRNECDAVCVSNSLSQETCSNCKKEINALLKPAFRCVPCDFKLCQECNRGNSHPAHVQHPLYWVNPTQHNGSSWKCGACNKTSFQIGETKCYHCANCNFSLCQSCFPSILHPLHPHQLTRTDVRYTYHESNGDWCCDSCGGNNGAQNFFPRHCSRCRFDLCDNCCKEHRSALHEHPLYKADSTCVYARFSGGWRCDNCSRSFNPVNNRNPFHCTICEYDLCEDCLNNGHRWFVAYSEPKRDGNMYSDEGNNQPMGKATYHDEACAELFGPPSLLSLEAEGLALRGISNKSVITRTAAGNPVTSPEEDVVDSNTRAAPEESSVCVICLSKPKDATIVHGTTGHVCCCMTCARELQRRRAPCPICRSPIDLVIKQFVS